MRPRAHLVSWGTACDHVQGVRICHRILLVFVAGLGLGACSTDPGITRVDGVGYFNPERLQYGVRTVGDVHELKTVLRNASGRRLRVLDVRFEPAQAFYAAFLTEGGTLRGTELETAQSVEITLIFRPLSEGDFDATLVVETAELEIPLEIAAEARQVAAGRPILEPAEVRFLRREVGRDVLQRVRVSNGGDTAAALSRIQAQSPYSVTAVGGAALVLPSVRLAPGEFIDVEVHYLAEVAGASEGTVTFWFDTGTQAELLAFGDAVQAGELTCDASVLDFGEVARGQRATRGVHCSVAGGPYVIDRMRFAPGGAAGYTLNPASPTLVDGNLDFEVVFEPIGFEGKHDGSVEIIPLHQLVTRVAATADVLPPPPGESDLEVSMVWNTGNSDFDLHLVRQPGLPFDRDNDCFFDNVNPDWGQMDYAGDDPILTTDDVNGFGPETLSLLHAAPGTYELWAQFYGYDQETPPSTTVIIDYRLRGQPVQTVARDLLECGVAWRVGRFDFDGSGGRFTADGALVNDYLARAAAVCRP